MQKININFSTSTAERFFIERSMELLHSKTIDTYRIRLHNSYTILEEMAEVVDKLSNQQLKNDYYAKAISDEIISIIKDDSILNWGNISKEYFIHLLNDYKNQKDKIFIACKTILRYNKNFLEKIFTNIEGEIQKLNQKQTFEPDLLSILNRLTCDLWTGVRSIGYSKEYLHTLVRALAYNKENNFQTFLSILVSLINRQKEKFTIILSIKLPLDRDDFKSENFTILSSTEIGKLSTSEYGAIKKYFSQQYGTIFKIEIDAYDYYSAAKLVKDKLFDELDILHIGKSRSITLVRPHWLVIGSNAPDKAKAQPFNYQIDGYYESSLKVYNNVSEKLEKIRSKKIDSNALKKITAGLRYYRLGSEATELQNKLLDYWIGMEYLFSASESDEGTIMRLKRFYMKMHGLLLFKRLIYDFHLSIKNLELHELTEHYQPNDLEYLMNKDVYDIFKNKINDYPLFAFRAAKVQELFEDSKLIRQMIKRSVNNIEWNLTRLYRIRNEIVHNAAIKSDIESLVSHLKFYLLFTICSLLEFFAEKADDYNFDGKISLDDYFELRELWYDNLIHGSDKNPIDIQKLKKFMNPLEFLS